MRYTMPDLIEYSGLAPRTIRKYISLGVIPPPEGNGGGALYTPHHLELVIAMSRMRAQGISLAVCIEELGRWSEPRLRRYLKESEPVAEAAAPPAAERKPAPALPPMSAPPALPPSGARARERGGKLQKPEPLLPDAPAYKFIPILPDLVLCLGERATPLVRRIAAEIYEKYAEQPGTRE